MTVVLKSSCESRFETELYRAGGFLGVVGVLAVEAVNVEKCGFGCQDIVVHIDTEEHEMPPVCIVFEHPAGQRQIVPEVWMPM